jgi:hypothetical protein
VSSPGLDFAPSTFSATNETYAVVGSVVTPQAKTVEIDGILTSVLVPFEVGMFLLVDRVDVEVVGYAVRGEDWDAPTPFAEVFRSSVLTVPLVDLGPDDESASFAATVALPDEVTAVTVHVTLPEAPWWEWSRSVVAAPARTSCASSCRVAPSTCVCTAASRTCTAIRRTTTAVSSASTSIPSRSWASAWTSSTSAEVGVAAAADA